MANLCTGPISVVFGPYVQHSIVWKNMKAPVGGIHPQVKDTDKKVWVQRGGFSQSVANSSGLTWDIRSKFPGSRRQSMLCAIEKRDIHAV